MTETPAEVASPESSAQKLKWARRWLGAFVALLVLLTHFPKLDPRLSEPAFYDKIAHFSLYAVLAILALRTVTLRTPGTSAVVRCAAVLAAVMAFGLLDEATQPLTARDFDWFDWLADNTGAIVGIAGYEVARRWKGLAA